VSWVVLSVNARAFRALTLGEDAAARSASIFCARGYWW
jgi:hypothetical protein